MKKQLIFLCVAFFTTVTICAQNKEELKQMALQDAQAACNATLKEDFKKLMTYTHKNLLDAAGGSEVMENYLKSTFSEMKAGGFKYLVAETKSVSDVVEEQGEYRCYIENYNVMQMKDKKITSTSYMLGFYNKDDKRWKFVEAKEMKETGTIIAYFPDFKTSLNIPENSSEVTDIKQ